MTFDLKYIHLLDLNVELKLWRQLSGKNIVEVLEVKMEMVARFSVDQGRTGIADFDQLVTDVNAFPVLCQVTFSIKCYVPRHSGKRRYIHEITEAQFPQLLKSTTIEFKFYTRTIDK